MDYLLLGSVILVFSAQTVCFKIFNRKLMKNLASYFMFNFVYFSAIAAVMPVFGLRLSGLHAQTALLAALFGVIFVVNILLYMKAMEHGPLSMTSLVFSLGILIPIAAGALFWNERITVLQVAALLLLFFTFYLGGEIRHDRQGKMKFKWLAYGIASLVTNGILMTITKAHQKMLPGLETGEFLFIAFGAAALASLLLYLRQRLALHEETVHLKSWLFAALALAAAVTTAYGNQAALLLSGRLPAIIQFPITNGGYVILSSVLSVVIFKERMTRNAWTGLALGLAALVIICL